MIIKPCYPTSGEPIHYLYAIAVLFVVEFAIMWYLNKYRGTEEYVPADVGAVDLTRGSIAISYVSSVSFWRSASTFCFRPSALPHEYNKV